MCFLKLRLAFVDKMKSLLDFTKYFSFTITVYSIGANTGLVLCIYQKPTSYISRKKTL